MLVNLGQSNVNLLKSLSIYTTASIQLLSLNLIKQYILEHKIKNWKVLHNNII